MRAGPALCDSNLQSAAQNSCRVCPGNKERIGFMTKSFISVKKCIPINATFFYITLFCIIFYIVFLVWFSSFILNLSMKIIRLGEQTLLDIPFS